MRGKDRCVYQGGLVTPLFRHLVLCCIFPQKLYQLHANLSQSLSRLTMILKRDVFSLVGVKNGDSVSG